MNTKKTKKQAGFTLIEIMIVVVIIGILSSIILPKIIDKPNEARVQKARSDIQTISSVLDLYKLDKFNYPTTDEGISVLVGQYLKKLPKDPWGNDYYYLSPGEHSDFDLYSSGVDKKLGGGDDINNWQ
ncbi:type II secretion system major pseudopilin GspG [Candidatus Thiodubiliella endoseptemdiera]|uniref:Type II secretion system core protein G n=1 Tax=Candidatus Thiodubiliella endoseptemdiera TaxID=2738886 RepID=A0A853F404_9GAMM|nr:type II secretion system major pseudopilin GspG [Candidatus Thiodubiliella endoseptemdiera]